MTVPLLTMVGELHRRQLELFKLLKAKDKEIDDYKGHGAKVSRSKYFDYNMFLSSGLFMSRKMNSW